MNLQQAVPKTRSVERQPESRQMRVWIDITGPAHVLVFRPLVEVLRGVVAAVRLGVSREELLVQRRLARA